MAREPSYGAPVAFVPAGKWRRFFNWLIDRVAVQLLVIVVAFAVGMLASDDALLWLEDIPWLADYLLAAVFVVVYYTPLEALFGVSLGKLVTRTRVVDENGHPARFGQVLVRSLCRSIPFNGFSVLLSDDARPRGWHDRIPRTWVVLRAGPAVVVPGPPDVPPA